MSDLPYLVATAVLNVGLAYLAVLNSSTALMAAVYYSIGSIIGTIILNKIFGNHQSDTIKIEDIVPAAAILWIFYDKFGVIGILTSFVVFVVVGITSNAILSFV
jgi:hypothetical protein